MASRVATIRVREFLVNQKRPQRARKAAKYIRQRIAHYSKLEPENVKLSIALNALIIKKYAKKMVPVKVNINIENGIAHVTPFVQQQKQTAQTAAQPGAQQVAKTPIIKSTPKQAVKPAEQQTQKKEQKPDKQQQQQKKTE